MARLEPSGTLIFTKGIRRLYDLPVFTAAGTLSITSYTCHTLNCMCVRCFRYPARPWASPLRDRCQQRSNLPGQICHLNQLLMQDPGACEPHQRLTLRASAGAVQNSLQPICYSIAAFLQLELFRV